MWGDRGASCIRRVAQTRRAAGRARRCWGMHIHHFLPDRDGQPEAGFTIPRYLRDLQRVIGALVEGGAAEHHAQGDFSGSKSVEVLGCGDVEVEGARQFRDRRECYR